MLRFLADRESGRMPPAQVRLAERTRRTFALDLASARVASPHRLATTTLHVDPVVGHL